MLCNHPRLIWILQSVDSIQFWSHKHFLITAKWGICYPSLDVWKYFHFRLIQLNFDRKFNDYESHKLCNYYKSKLATESTQLSFPYHLIKLNISNFIRSFMVHCHSNGKFDICNVRHVVFVNNLTFSWLILH